MGGNSWPTREAATASSEVVGSDYNVDKLPNL